MERKGIRILGNYKEMKKAMQVFGDIDERKTAAQKLRRLRQVRSVTEYITAFQTITSSLDWNEEALEDKFLEGLKYNVRSDLYTSQPNEQISQNCSREPRRLYLREMQTPQR
jgi:retrotransposon gag protein